MYVCVVCVYMYVYVCVRVCVCVCVCVCECLVYSREEGSIYMYTAGSSRTLLNKARNARDLRSTNCLITLEIYVRDCIAQARIPHTADCLVHVYVHISLASYRPPFW